MRWNNSKPAAAPDRVLRVNGGAPAEVDELIAELKQREEDLDAALTESEVQQRVKHCAGGR